MLLLGTRGKTRAFGSAQIIILLRYCYPELFFNFSKLGTDASFSVGHTVTFQTTAKRYTYYHFPNKKYKVLHDLLNLIHIKSFSFT